MSLCGDLSMHHTVYLCLGTNLGERLDNLKAAIAALPPHVHPLALSPIYETEPWGYPDQPPFLNQVVKAETKLTPEALLTYLKALETTLGRQSSFRYGPRLIDLDILLYDDLILETPDLIIPHPHLHERGFVLVPLADLAPGLRHPVLERTVEELLAETDTRGVVKYAS